MTNEEAIESIKFGHCDDIYYRKEYEEAVNMAIKALEQESVLYKIRAEIMLKDGLEEALEIIDKYKAESENKEWKNSKIEKSKEK